MEIPICMHHTILSVDYITYYLHAFSQTQPPGGFQWYILKVFTRHYFSSFAHTFHHDKHDAIHILLWYHIVQMKCNILDISYVKHIGLSILYCLHSVFDTIQTSTKHHDYIHLIMICVPIEYFPRHIQTLVISYITANLPSSWDLKFHCFEPVIPETQSMPYGLVYVFSKQQYNGSCLNTYPINNHGNWVR